MIFERKQLAQLADREIEITQRLRFAEAQLSAHQATTAESAWAGGDNVETELDAVLRAEQKTRALRLALDGCHSKRVAAIDAQRRKEAEELRAESARARREAASIRKRTAVALRVLSRAEGVVYTETILSCEPGAGAPRSVKLEAVAFRLEERAADLLQAELKSGGTIDLEDVTDPDPAVVVARAVLNTAAITPTAVELIEWVEATEAAARRRGFTIGARPRQIRVAWVDGKLDEAGSWIMVRDLAPVVERNSNIDFTRDFAYNFAAVTFRPDRKLIPLQTSAKAPALAVIGPYSDTSEWTPPEAA